MSVGALPESGSLLSWTVWAWNRSLFSTIIKFKCCKLKMSSNMGPRNLLENILNDVPVKMFLLWQDLQFTEFVGQPWVWFSCAWFIWTYWPSAGVFFAAADLPDKTSLPVCDRQRCLLSLNHSGAGQPHSRRRDRGSIRQPCPSPWGRRPTQRKESYRRHSYVAA